MLGFEATVGYVEKVIWVGPRLRQQVVAVSFAWIKVMVGSPLT